MHGKVRFWERRYRLFSIMADPLSIAAGVVGVVTAAAHISIILTKFTYSAVLAPKQAHSVLLEVSDISGILSHLQSFLLGPDAPNRSRTSLLKVEKVVAVVSGCVLTFSELEKLLDEMKMGDLDILDRFKWARKESAIVDLIRRLQNHKASLSLVLNILNGHTIAEAKDSVDRLHAFVEKFYKEMSSRVQELELEILSRQENNASGMSEDDTESTMTIREHRPNVSSKEMMKSEIGHFEFSEELQRSRVYRRNQALRESVISALTNSAYSLGWSFFSDLSMAEVSNISVIDLVITEGEVFNPRRYSQTWSAQPNGAGSTNDDLGGQHTQPYKIAHESVQAETSAAAARAHSPASTQTQQQSPPQIDSPLSPTLSIPAPHGEELLGAEENTKNAQNLDSTSTLSQSELLDRVDLQSLPQVQGTSSPGSYDRVEDAAFPESPIVWDGGDPCKGCGEIVTEAKAFELGTTPMNVLRNGDTDNVPAGNRWHIGCFRCSTCGTLIDPDTNFRLNFRLLGDESLICTNCTYICSVCNTKIEDLTILTEDRAFCATCFKCRSCKISVGNLKYARISQGIFCLECYESLKQSRKKSKRAREKHQERVIEQYRANQKLLRNSFRDKALPSSPPSSQMVMKLGSDSSGPSPHTNFF